MAELSKDNKYWVDPTDLENLGEAIRSEVAILTPFADICEKLTPRIAEASIVEGVDNIPVEEPLILVKNHPCHFDLLLLGQIFNIRPDVKILAKVSQATSALPTSNALFIRKNGPHGNPADIKAMQEHLEGNGSFLATPWGALDHQARQCATPERAVQNVIRYASFSGAAVLPVCIDSEWANSGAMRLPLQKAHVTIHEPIAAKSEEISRVVSAMYEQYVA